MKTYCTQNNGKCATCSLVNYGRDCHNTPLEDDLVESIGHNEEMQALIASVRCAIERIERDQEVILDNLPNHASIIDRLYALSATNHMPIVERA